MSNRLAGESSPYLLQHSENPVEWYPWGPEAFDRAQSENRPIFLSIGYSTCHWCHVMARESFEDPDVARLMNEAFVSIKVDREERPDIDGVYMSACQMMTGGGGWPLTIVMTPDGKPFFAATYIPREERFGMAGMLELIPRIREFWRTERGRALDISATVAGALQRAHPGGARRDPDASTLERGYAQLLTRFDQEYAGFGTSPKFPSPHNLLFLLRYWKRTGEPAGLEMVERTLRAMRLGGIYDHIGFGFHRYSTDRQWLVPHFEKMLYDQAMLAMAYAEAYQATGKNTYAGTARELFAYVLRRMTAPEGGFYSAEDADSEGEEGRFYLWTARELREALGERDAALAAELFNIRAGGNIPEQGFGGTTGANIPYLRAPLEDLASGLGVSERQIEERAAAIREALFAQREKRVHPLRDDKILTDWNGLMIAALAKGAQALLESRYGTAARRAADFLLSRMRKPDGRLLHRWRDSQAGIDGTLDDYSFLAWGLLELYEAVFDPAYLKAAVDLTRDMLAHFWDDEHGGFYMTPDDGEPLLARKKESYDGAIPSGNSVAMLNLLRLGRMTGRPDFEEKAGRLARALSPDVEEAPSAHAQLLVALDFALGPPSEVVIAGDALADDTRAMLQTLMKEFLPGTVVLLRPTGHAAAAITDLSPFTAQQRSLDGRATAYVCRNYTCESATTDIAAMRRSLPIAGTSTDGIGGHEQSQGTPGPA